MADVLERIKQDFQPGLASEAVSAQEALAAAWADADLAELIGGDALALLGYAAAFDGSSCDLGEWRWQHAGRVAGVFAERALLDARERLEMAFPLVPWLEPLPGCVPAAAGPWERLLASVWEAGPRPAESRAEKARARAFWASVTEGQI